MQISSTSPLPPAPIGTFFTHHATDPRAASHAFSESAVVLDESRAHHGRAAIAAWNADVVSKYRFVAEPLSAETNGDTTTVVTRVTGSFPASPARFRFQFVVVGGLITRLEIAP